MTPAGYQRPALKLDEYRDDAGAVIPYGRRWFQPPYDGSPPDWAYSVTAHPERFAPLRTVTDAVVAYLVRAFRVEVAEFVGPDDALPPVVLRYLGLGPAWMSSSPRTTVLAPSGGGATLSVMRFENEHGFPSVMVFAGDAFDYNVLSCGCDACDDGIEDLADELERVCFDIAEGYFFERWGRDGLTVGHNRPGVGGSWSGPTRTGHPRDVRRAVKASQKARGGASWPAWERRETPTA